MAFLKAENTTQHPKSGFLKLVAKGAANFYMHKREEACSICYEIIKKLNYYSTQLNWLKYLCLKSKVLAGIPEPIRNYLAEKLSDRNFLLTLTSNSNPIMDDNNFPIAYDGNSLRSTRGGGYSRES